MDFEKQLKLQAFLDGELPEPEAREIANWLAQDQQAALLLAELRNTRESLKGAEAFMPLPESREFYWSKIAREIDRLEPAARPPQAKPSWVAMWRRYLMPAGAIAAALLVALMVVAPNRGADSESEAAMSDPGAFTYRDYSAQATLVWLSYPAENEIADGERADTLQ
ncbi:MAG TPA: hypothetical protein VLT36_05485 [Candidatus Dormibacteraeota bacterium]|nr:hypothetical protein [Candidatus Dormibacteraeota bacterium]